MDLGRVTVTGFFAALVTSLDVKVAALSVPFSMTGLPSDMILLHALPAEHWDFKTKSHCYND